MKSIKAMLKRSKERYRVPRCVRDVIPVQAMWKDGIFRVGNRYSMTFSFTDINYQAAGKANQEAMFLSYSELLNSLDSNAVTKLTIFNHALQKIDFEREFLISNYEEELEVYGEEMNRVMRDKTINAGRVLRTLLLTVTVERKNIEEARAYFTRVGTELKTHFSALGSTCTPMDAEARLRIFHNFYRKGDEEAFTCNIEEDMRRGHDFRDRICPDRIERHKDHLRLGDRYARAIYLKDFASYIKDDMIGELTGLNRTMMLSIDIIPVSTEEAIRLAQNKQLAVETNITNWQRRQNRNNNYTAEIPYDMELQRKEIKEFLDDLSSRDQRMMLSIVSMVITADTKKQLDEDTEAIMSIARKHMCQAAVLKYQQMDGLNTTMPFGVCKLSAWRTLTTEALAVLMPFKVQEIMDKGGIYYGENAISHNLILCNKENLMNQSAMLLGVPGSGKSFSAKMLIFLLLLSTQDDIIICDPEGEYATLASVLPKNSSVIRIAAGGKDRLNPMYMEEGYGEGDPMVDKSQFIMSLIEQIDKNGVGPQHKSIIDRCTRMIYQEAEGTGTTPTLSDLREKLMEQPEPEARQVALALELFTTGSLDIFGKDSNVDLNKRKSRYFVNIRFDEIVLIVF